MKYVFIDMESFLGDFFGGNQSKCAKELSISQSSIWRLLHKANNPGAKVTTSIISYCEEAHIDYRKYFKL